MGEIGGRDMWGGQKSMRKDEGGEADEQCAKRRTDNAGSVTKNGLTCQSKMPKRPRIFTSSSSLQVLVESIAENLSAYDLEIARRIVDRRIAKGKPLDGANLVALVMEYRARQVEDDKSTTADGHGHGLRMIDEGLRAVQVSGAGDGLETVPVLLRILIGSWPWRLQWDRFLVGALSSFSATPTPPVIPSSCARAAAPSLQPSSAPPFRPPRCPAPFAGSPSAAPRATV